MLFDRRCPRCGRSGSGVCHRCLAATQPVGVVNGLTGLRSVRVLVRYDDVASALILAAKNGGRKDILVGLGRRLAQAAAGERRRWHQVTWVPASRQGQRDRGQDHGRILARTVASELDLPCRKLLVRSRGPAQTGRDREARLAGPNLRAPAPVRGSVLLVDDVITTGASLDAAASALVRAGADRVCGLAVAWRCSFAEAATGRPTTTAFGPYRDRAGPSMVR